MPVNDYISCAIHFLLTSVDLVSCISLDVGNAHNFLTIHTSQKSLATQHIRSTHTPGKMRDSKCAWCPSSFYRIPVSGHNPAGYIPRMPRMPKIFNQNA